MDYQLLSRMLSELLRENDSVSVPCLGTFVAADVPASFSDRGFTINPPYRKVSFVSGESQDTLLISLYSKVNDISYDDATAILAPFLSDAHEALVKDGLLKLPGFGKLRLTRSGTPLFIPDAEFESSLDTFALVPVSLKNLPSPTYEGLGSGAAVEMGVIPADMEPVELVEEVPEEVVSPPAEEATAADETSAAGGVPANQVQVEVDENPVRRSGGRRFLVALIWIVVVLFVALAAFAALGRIAPDYVDSFLYTPEELRIINY